jgi:hypothetical protein
MAIYTSAETSAWVATNLRKSEGVSKVEQLSDQVLQVSRTNYDPFVAGIVAVTRVDAETIAPLARSELEVEIIANVPKESYWTGGALTLAKRHNIATGSYGDLLRAIRLPNVRAFQTQETAFVERGLSQHDRISGFERVHDRLYRIRREGRSDLTVSMLNYYELTADHLRTARERYGPFSIAVITNPNGRPSTSAEEAGRIMGIEILKWGPFFGRLNQA